MEYITYAIKQLVYHVETNGILTIKTKKKIKSRSSESGPRVREGSQVSTSSLWWERLATVWSWFKNSFE